MEQRKSQGLKITSQNRLAGLAVPFGFMARLSEQLWEKVEPGAFTDSLKANDVLCLSDHDTTKILGRTSSQTLTLRETSKGLEYEILLPETQLGRDTRELALRGDLGGVSVGFFIVRQETTGNTRRILQADLREISIISAFPAYPQTTIEARSAKQLLTNYLRWAVYA